MLFIYIQTLGCKANQYESSCILDDFQKQGYHYTDDMSKADIIIINTCTVTNRTDYKSRNLINKAIEQKKQRPSVKIIITGCYSQINKKEITKSGWIDLVIDNNNKHKIVELINQNVETFIEAIHFTDFAEMSMTNMQNRNRAILKIQDGCNFNCAYCIVPAVRGTPRSRSFQSIEKQLYLLLDNGYSEIVLSGINLGLYDDLPALLYKLNDFHRLKSIRLGSIEPQLFSVQLQKTISDIDKICPHFHIPLQTGSDTLLNMHGRKYTAHDFVELVNSLQRIKAYPAIGLDIIVGLPGETDELFEETYTLLQNLSFTYLHVFVFSIRKGTLAATMKNQVHGSIAKTRSKLLIELAEQKKKEYIATLIKNKIEINVVPEGFDEKRNLYYGTSDRYIKVYFKNPQTHTDGVIKLILKKQYADGAYGYHSN